MQRRELLIRALAAGGALGTLGATSGCASRAGVPSKAKVVVVGGGFAGATAAKYIRLFSGGAIDVLLVEPNPAFISCPVSNLVVAGFAQLADITTPYDGLATHGITLVRDSVRRVDLANKSVALDKSGAAIHYDKLVLAPGIDMMFDEVRGLRQAHASGRILQAWKAGEETLALRRQLQAMPDGGVFAIVVPEQPYRCPPGPYERACLAAEYFKSAKPRSKVLILDANLDVTSKGSLFKQAWRELYPGMIEFRGQHKAVAVDANAGIVKFEVQPDVKADVLNVLPPMRAGALAVQTGLANANGRWCRVHYRTFESTDARDVHVIGDSVQAAPRMPKSGHMANGEGKVCAAAIVAELMGLEPDPRPMMNNTCYSFVAEDSAIRDSTVHEYVAAEETFKLVPHSGGLSAERSELEARYAHSWAHNIWADTLG